MMKSCDEAACQIILLPSEKDSHGLKAVLTRDLAGISLRSWVFPRTDRYPV